MDRVCAGYFTHGRGTLELLQMGLGRWILVSPGLKAVWKEKKMKHV